MLAPPALAAKGKAKAAAAAPVVAVETPEAHQAREAREHGIVALNLGRYEEAARELEKAYEMSRDPNILFSLVTAFRLAGKPERALALCASFLRSTDALNASNRPQIERTVAELEIIVEQMRMRPGEPAGARRAAPVEAVEPPPLAEDLVVKTPSKPPLLAAAVPVPRPSSDSDGNSNLIHSKAPPPVAERRRPFYRTVWFWTAVGVVAASTAGFLIYESTRSPGPPATTLGAQRMF
jgi:hypothetical protein